MCSANPPSLPWRFRNTPWVHVEPRRLHGPGSLPSPHRATSIGVISSDRWLNKALVLGRQQTKGWRMDVGPVGPCFQLGGVCQYEVGQILMVCVIRMKRGRRCRLSKNFTSEVRYWYQISVSCVWWACWCPVVSHTPKTCTERDNSLLSLHSHTWCNRTTKQETVGQF